MAMLESQAEREVPPSTNTIGLCLDSGTIWLIGVFIFIFILGTILFSWIIVLLVLQNKSERSGSWLWGALPKNGLGVIPRKGVDNDLEAGVYERNGQRTILPAMSKYPQTVKPVPSPEGCGTTNDRQNITIPVIVIKDDEIGRTTTLTRPASDGIHSVSTGIPTSPRTSVDTGMLITITPDFRLENVPDLPRPLPQVHIKGSRISEYIRLSSVSFDNIERRKLIPHVKGPIKEEPRSRFSAYSSDSGV
ncbi:hypothetical protein TWF506_007397 [Arthrobotrys conoides]|uniref:Uncharacterized protein n=1 Tax=Arthrobotrys conoides TaxID=74498 RepID=A0AAN8NAH1_9PEZI